MASLLLWGACGLVKPNQEQRMGELGRFKFRASDNGMEGVIIGTPHGSVESAAADYANFISEQTGAALVIAYGFGTKRLAVTRPIVQSLSAPPIPNDALRRGSVYAEFKEFLQRTANGAVKFYVGFRAADKDTDLDQIEVATVGLTFEEIKVLKQSFLRIRDQALRHSPIAKISLAMEPLDKIAWRASGVKHHGVLMIAEKGLNIRIPKILSAPGIKPIYQEVLSLWTIETLKLVRENQTQLPNIHARLLDYGKIESIPSRSQRKGIVIGAPHGTFDEHTAELVQVVSYRTGLAAVIATGFTPSECSGWRINVNRPSERRYPSGDLEIHSARAQKVYQAFKQAVLAVSQEELGLYVDVHQNGRQKNIEIATVGISKQQAGVIKKAYREVRDEVLKLAPGVAAVDLLVEPSDAIEIGAWAAKADGILSVVKKSLHFELPLYETLRSPNARDAYTAILAILLSRTAPTLLNTD